MVAPKRTVLVPGQHFAADVADIGFLFLAFDSVCGERFQILVGDSDQREHFQDLLVMAVVPERTELVPGQHIAAGAAGSGVRILVGDSDSLWERRVQAVISELHCCFGCQAANCELLSPATASEAAELRLAEKSIVRLRQLDLRPDCVHLRFCLLRKSEKYINIIKWHLSASSLLCFSEFHNCLLNFILFLFDLLLPIFQADLILSQNLSSVFRFVMRNN